MRLTTLLSRGIIALGPLMLVQCKAKERHYAAVGGNGGDSGAGGRDSTASSGVAEGGRVSDGGDASEGGVTSKTSDAERGGSAGQQSSQTSTGGQPDNCQAPNRDCDGRCISPGECCVKADCPTGASCEDGACKCAEGSHLCGEACVSNDSTEHCGVACTACQVPTGGNSTCDGNSCGAECPSAQKLCAGECIEANLACTGVCSDDYHDCSGICAPDTDPAACGASCKTCPVPANSDATCTAGTCGFTCKTDFKRCGDVCIAKSACCEDTDCQENARCSTSHVCECTSGYEACGASCILTSDCCTANDCPQRSTICASATTLRTYSAASCESHRCTDIATDSRCGATCDSASNACKRDAWYPTTQVGAPVARAQHVAVWTGTRMIVWGGKVSGGSGLAEGGASYDRSTDSWSAISTVNQPSKRSGATAVWTGSEMIVWGGLGDSGDALGDGGRYNPNTNTWTPIVADISSPGPRFEHTAVWTGTHMIIAGGYDGSTWGSGIYLYEPKSNAWSSYTSAAGVARFKEHCAVWTGSKLILWGGNDSDWAPLRTGLVFNPSSYETTTTSTTNAPEARASATAVWTGSEMIVWGGYNTSEGANYLTGARYNPVSDSWTALPATTALAGTHQHSAIWTGTEMMIWGGKLYPNTGASQAGARYSVGSGWTALALDSYTPSIRAAHSAVWTGKEMIVWGGELPREAIANTGGRYAP